MLEIDLDLKHFQLPMPDQALILLKFQTLRQK
jgi:hypothetical protein